MKKDKDCVCKAEKMGKLYAKHILELDDEVKTLKGGSWNKFFSGFKSGFKTVAPAISTVATLTGNPEVALAVSGVDALLGNGKKGKVKKDKPKKDKPKKDKPKKGGSILKDYLEKRKKMGAGAMKDKVKPKKKTNEKMKRRGELIKKLMKDRKVSFIEASKLIKAEKMEY